MIKSLIKKILLSQGYVISKILPEDAQWQAHRNYLEDTKALVGDADDLCIMDIGAYIGQMAMAYRSRFPKARILAFEPCPESFNLLTKKVQGLNIECHKMAIAEKSGHTELQLFDFAPANSILPPHPNRDKVWGENKLEAKGRLQIEAITLEDAFNAFNITHLNVLKLDVQGLEHQILNAAKGLLKAGRIDFIYLELILLPTYQNQETLANYFKLMEEFGFELHNFYNLSSVDGQLRQVDALFKQLK